MVTPAALLDRGTWSREIAQAIDRSDVIVALLSAGYAPTSSKAVFQPVAVARLPEAHDSE
jgi:hypothetical protein